MKYFYYILRILVGLTFIVSALAKLYPIESFENTFIELGVSNWTFAPFLARLVIALELFIGLSIIFNLWLKNKVYYLAQGVLAFFTTYLVFLLFTKGNDIDCGCFGNLIELSPIESIAKNFVMIIALLFIPRQYHKYGHAVKIGVIFILIFSVTLPLSLNPIGVHNLQGVEVNHKVDLSELPALYKTKDKVDFSKGNKVVVFLSYKCKHCINATKKLVLLDKQQKINNLYLIIGSKREEGLISFIEDNKPNFPIIWMKGDDFFKYSGGRLPAIFYLEDGVMKKKWFGDRFDVEDIRKYFRD
jgi:uncharacterized membrane protein YphA (DoxX/SURF4 family)